MAAGSAAGAVGTSGGAHACTPVTGALSCASRSPPAPTISTASSADRNIEPFRRAIGLVVYFLYARNRSHLAPGNEKLLHGYGDPLPAAPLVHEGPEPGP